MTALLRTAFLTILVAALSACGDSPARDIGIDRERLDEQVLQALKGKILKTVTRPSDQQTPKVDIDGVTVTGVENGNAERTGEQTRTIAVEVAFTLEDPVEYLAADVYDIASGKRYFLTDTYPDGTKITWRTVASATQRDSGKWAITGPETGATTPPLFPERLGDRDAFTFTYIPTTLSADSPEGAEILRRAEQLTAEVARAFYADGADNGFDLDPERFRITDAHVTAKPRSSGNRFRIALDLTYASDEALYQVEVDGKRVTAAPTEPSGTLPVEVEATYEGGEWGVQEFRPQSRELALPMDAIEQAAEHHGLELVVQAD